MGNTEELWRAYRREYKRVIDQRDKANAHEGKMYVSEFARVHRIAPWVLRRRMRLAGYVREGNRNLVPIEHLERFLLEGE
jgi:hypothetical protein